MKSTDEIVLHNLVPACQLGAARGGRPRRGHPLPRHPHLQPRAPCPQAEGQAAEIGRGQLTHIYLPD